MWVKLTDIWYIASRNIETGQWSNIFHLVVCVREKVVVASIKKSILYLRTLEALYIRELIPFINTQCNLPPLEQVFTGHLLDSSLIMGWSEELLKFFFSVCLYNISSHLLTQESHFLKIWSLGQRLFSFSNILLSERLKAFSCILGRFSGIFLSVKTCFDLETYF